MTAHSTRLVLVPGLACTEDLFADQITTLRGDLAISVADHTRHDTVSGIARAVLRLAAEAGRKGGQSVNPTKRSFSRNHALASEAGRKGGHASHPGPKKAGDQE